MMSVKKPKRGRPKGSGSKVPKVSLHAKVPAALKAAMQRKADSNDNDLTEELILALKRHIADLPSAPKNGA